MADHYTFLSWVRDGAAALADEPEQLGADGPVRARLDIGLDIEALSGVAPARVGRPFVIDATLVDSSIGAAPPRFGCASRATLR